MLFVAFVLLLAFIAVHAVPSRYRLALWILVIIGGVVPWVGFVGHSHWSRVGWLPFISGPVRLRDIVINVALYVPFGWFFPARSSRLGSILRAGAAAVLLSVATEATQVYSHGRFPSMTDVVTNVAGAVIGSMLRWR